MDARETRARRQGRALGRTQGTPLSCTGTECTHGIERERGVPLTAVEVMLAWLREQSASTSVGSAPAGQSDARELHVYVYVCGRRARAMVATAAVACVALMPVATFHACRMHVELLLRSA